MPAVRLRGHHLLCVLCYKGEGYTRAFVENLDGVVERINEGGEIEMVAGIDDICDILHRRGAEPCDHAANCFEASVTRRDETALAELSCVLQRDLSPGGRLLFDKDLVGALRRLFAAGAIRAACEGCLWKAACTQIAADGFSGVKLYP